MSIAFFIALAWVIMGAGLISASAPTVRDAMMQRHGYVDRAAFITGGLIMVVLWPIAVIVALLRAGRP